MSVREALVLWTLALVAAFGCNSKGDCQTCKAACGHGLVTSCAHSSPPACGGQPVTQFCPNGCSTDSPDQCSASPIDGGAGVGCAASSATVQQGALARQGATQVAVTSSLPRYTRVIVATTSSAACASAKDAGTGLGSGSGAVLVLSIPPNLSGQSTVGSGASAELTMWDNGSVVIDHQSATAGTVFVSVSQPGAGTIGTYDLTFAGGAERGTFVAPECDICGTGS